MEFLAYFAIFCFIGSVLSALATALVVYVSLDGGPFDVWDDEQDQDGDW